MEKENIPTYCSVIEYLRLGTNGGRQNFDETNAEKMFSNKAGSRAVVLRVKVMKIYKNFYFQNFYRVRGFSKVFTPENFVNFSTLS